ncbi:calcium-binding protein, partial [Shewanella sp. 1_MG-2023]|uniref:calcium-binding protein n=1 Tax=unclassified Shewanella TaxID=196818 RepID=UPI0026E2CD5C
NDGTVVEGDWITHFGIEQHGTAEDDSISGSNINSTIKGFEGNDTLSGGLGDDTLDGGAGDDLLNGGFGSDIYHFDIGSGQDIVSNYDSSPSSIDVAHFDDISIEDLWLSQNENDLQINIVGTDDQVTISDWYSGGNYQLDQIEMGGEVLLNAQLEQLVSAMASFDVPTGVGSIVTQEAKDAIKPVLVESWQTI